MDGTRIEAWRPVSEATWIAGDAIPSPTGAPLLRVEGLIGAANEGDAIVMDRAAIEALGLYENVLLDPFEEREILFRGVRWPDLLSMWRVDDEATTLLVRALNDYEVEVPIDALREGPALLALYSDGERMEPDYRGPAMIAFPRHVPNYDHSVLEPWWVWQVASIEVR